MILGGAQENTLLTCLGQKERHQVTLVTGPAQGPEGSLLQRAVAAGLEVVLVPSLQRAVHPWRDGKSFRALVGVFRGLKPDLVHTHSAKAGILGRYAARRAGVKHLVHTIHGLPFFPGQAAWLNALAVLLERRAARFTDRIIGVAEAMRDQALAAGVGRPEQYVTIYSGMEVEPFLRGGYDRAGVRAEFGLAAEALVIGKIARLFALKGHEYLIAAAPRVVAACPRARFLLVGNGILQDQLRALVAAKGLREHFVFAGLQPPERIPELVAAMDLLVHASLREGLARTLPQALLSGVAAVSFDIDGAREVIEDGVTGRLIVPKDTGSLAAAIIELLADEGKRREMGRLGRARCLPRFRAEHMVAEIEKVYEQVMGGN